MNQGKAFEINEKEQSLNGHGGSQNTRLRSMIKRKKRDGVYLIIQTSNEGLSNAHTARFTLHGTSGIVFSLVT